MKEKHRLEWPIAKYFTQPRRMGLIFSITPPTGCERDARKISLSLTSKAVRFLPFGNSSGIHRPRNVQTRRNSNPEIRSFRLAVDPPYDSCLRSLPLVAWPIPRVAVAPLLLEAIAGAAVRLPESPGE